MRCGRWPTPVSLADAPVTLVAGPEEYLFGEEKALLEVIEGNEPMPRWLPPYLHGLFATTPQEGWSAGAGGPDAVAGAGANPTLVSNVETFANVPLILTRGAGWYRGIGTADTAGPDRVHRGRRRDPSGLRRGRARDTIARRDRPGSAADPLPGRSIKAVLSGFSNAVLTAADLDAPVSYDGLAAVGSGLGSAGFVVYDDTRSMLAVARMVSRFLYVESCGQCRACKQGCGEVTRHLDAIAGGRGEMGDVDVIARRLRIVTDQNRCFLGEQEQRVISSLLRTFPEDFVAELEHPAPIEPLAVPKIIELRDGVATYDDTVMRKRPDWTYES